MRINNRNNSAQVLDVSAVSTADNALVQLWAYGGGNNQQWLAGLRGRRLLPLRQPKQRQVSRRARRVHGRQCPTGAVHLQRHRRPVVPVGRAALALVAQPSGCGRPPRACRAAADLSTAVVTTLAVVLLPQNPPERLRSIARAADDAGLEQLWLWEDCFLQGGMTTAAALLAWTERLHIAVGLLPVPLRNVALAAMEIATVQRLFPGRVTVGVGHGVQRWMAQIGADVASPMALLREHLTALQALLRGEEVTTAGHHVRLDAVRLDWPSGGGVFAGATGPRTLRLAGELADGTILSGGTTPDDVRAARQQLAAGQAKAGRSAAHPVAVYVHAATGPDAAQRFDTERQQWGYDSMNDVGVLGDAAQIAAGVARWAEAGADMWCCSRRRTIPTRRGSSDSWPPRFARSCHNGYGRERSRRYRAVAGRVSPAGGAQTMESITKNRQSPDVLRAMVSRAYGEGQVPDGDAWAEELGHGWFNVAYRIRLRDGQRVVLKIARPGDVEVMTYERGLMRTEVQALTLIRAKTAVPVPAIHHYDHSHELCDADYFFMEFVDAENLSLIKDQLSTAENAAYDEAIGAANWSLNQLGSDRFGPLEGRGANTLARSSPAWSRCPTRRRTAQRRPRVRLRPHPPAPGRARQLPGRGDRASVHRVGSVGRQCPRPRRCHRRHHRPRTRTVRRSADGGRVRCHATGRLGRPDGLRTRLRQSGVHPIARTSAAASTTSTCSSSWSSRPSIADTRTRVPTTGPGPDCPNNWPPSDRRCGDWPALRVRDPTPEHEPDSAQHGTGEAEPDVVDSEGRVAAAADGGPAAPVLVEPAAAAQHPIGAVDLGVVDVPAPVPDVAEHVVEAPRVGLLAAHFVDPLGGVAAIPGDLVERPVPRAGRTGAARVLPLGLGRQPVPVGSRVPVERSSASRR